MLILVHFDWFGPIADLKELEEKIRKKCDETEGLEFKGRYGPHNKKYHWTFIFKAKNYTIWNDLTVDYVRDYNVHTHQEQEIYEGPV